MALSAFVVCRTEVAPFVAYLIDAFEVTFPIGGGMQQTFDGELGRAVADFMLCLQPNSRVSAREKINMATTDATQRFEALVNGTRAPESTLRADQDTLLQPAGHEDMENICDGRLQGALFQICGLDLLQKLAQQMASKEKWDCMRRMRELRDSSTLHEWLDSSSPKRGAILSSNEFVDSLRLRLGASFTEDGSECRKCGIPVDSRMVHAQCCDRSNATKGHYRVRDCVHVLASIHDPLI